MPGRQDEAITPDVGNGNFLHLRQWMIQRCNDNRIVRDDGVVDEVFGYLKHGTDREIHGIGAQHLHAVTAGFIGKAQFDRRILVREEPNRFRQYVKDGRLTRGDIQFTRGQIATMRIKGFLEPIDPLHMRQAQIVKDAALGCQAEFRAAAFEQNGVHFFFERMNL